MNFFPQNILIVADFTSDRKMAIKKAVEIIDPQRTVVHLLHVVKSWNPFASFELNPPFRGLLKGDIVTYVRIMLQLQEWKQEIEEASPGVAVKIHIQKGFRVDKTIVTTIRRLAPDLAIVTRSGLTRKLFCRVIMISNAYHNYQINSLEASL